MSAAALGVAVVGGMLLQGGSMCGQGLVASMESLFAVRVFLAAGQGAVTAPALALISHMVKDPGHRATANSVFGTGVYLGTGLAAGGGLMAVHFGWRVTSAALFQLCLSNSCKRSSVVERRSLKSSKRSSASPTSTR